MQFKQFTNEEKDIYVNERFAASLFINECFPNGGDRYIGGEDVDKLDKYLDFLLYYFKYRECDPQVVDLAIESVKLGLLAKQK